LIREKFGIFIILFLMIFLSYASSEELAVNSGSLSSPGPLVLPSATVSDANASGRAIMASIETAAGIMGHMDQGSMSDDSDLLIGRIKSSPLPDSVQNPFPINNSGDSGLLDAPKDVLSISGMVFNDLMGEGPRTQNKSGLAGWTLILKSEGKEDRQAYTDDKGQYTFGDLVPGRYTLIQVKPDGWNQTAPLEESYVINLVDKDAFGYDFGNHFGPVPFVERKFALLSMEQMERMNEQDIQAAQAPTREEAMQVPVSYPTSFSLLGHVPNYNSRDQGDYCGSCWVWSSTAVMEIAHHIQDSIFSRLSIQYFNSNYNGGSGSSWACCSASPVEYASFYNSVHKFIPWSNANADYRDGNQKCSDPTTMPAGLITTTPNYPISSLTQYYITTQTASQAQAIDNIKYILNQNKGVTFRFGLPNAAARNAFMNFWYTSSGTFDFASYQGQTVDSEYGGHVVTCVGYDDSTDSWIMLNSWGANSAHPDGTFKVKMHTKYDLTFSTGSYQLWFGTFDVAFDTTAKWTGLGGYTTYKHNAIVDNQGRRHVFVIGGDNALWDNVDGSWISLGGVLTSAPYAAKDKNGRIHIVARGSDYALWDFVFDTASWAGGWKGLGGYLSSLATAAMEPTYGVWMKIVVRGGDNSLWLCEFNVNDLSSYNWISLGGSLNSWPFVIFDQNSRMHTFAAGGDNALWDNRGVLSSGTYYHNWHGLGGIIQGAPFSTLKPGYSSYLLAMVRGLDNSLWIADINGLNNPETSVWRGFSGVITSETFASTDSSGGVHTFARGGDGAMWENVFSSNPWNPSGARWVGHGGSIIGSPQALLDGQIHAYVKGGDNAIWCKVYPTSVPTSSVGEESGKVDSPVEAVTLVVGATGSSKV
jgi:hypothetical protein